jgi:hypothetical protein
MFGPWAPLAVPSARLSGGKCPEARCRLCTGQAPKLGRPVTAVEDPFGWVTASLRLASASARRAAGHSNSQAVFPGVVDHRTDPPDRPPLVSDSLKSVCQT